MGGQPLTPEERGRIHAYHECGIGVREIARRMQRSTDTVRRVILPPPPLKARKRGPQPLLSDRDVRRIVRKACTGEFTAAQLKDECQIVCSARTIRRVLARVDYLIYSKMERTLPLTPEHKAARLAWAKANVLRSESEWAATVFSDEKRFCLDGPDGFKDYWQDLRRPAREYVQRQSGGGSIMVWGAFSSRGKAALAILDGKQRSADYIYTVSEHMLPFAHRMYGTDFTYQQDNAAIHCSRETMDFFSEMQITLLAWPARSPDLNPIENVWAMLARSIYQGGKQYKSVGELRDAILVAWDAVPMEALLHLLESMPRRCIEVIEKKGGRTHY